MAWHQGFIVYVFKVLKVNTQLLFGFFNLFLERGCHVLEAKIKVKKRLESFGKG